MGLFNKEVKKLTSDEYDKCLKSISELSASISSIAGRIMVLETNINSLRGLVNRRFLPEEQKQEEEKPEELKTQNINTPKTPFD